tara:strand:+ start:1905 stop:2324 length:420 start_codon:yes stop_codon:yes gene_type:complete
MSELITGEVKTDTLTGKTTAKNVTVTVGSSTTQILEKGLAKVWVYFDTLVDSSNPTIRASLNVSSLIDETTEDGINLTSAMSSAFYVPTAGGGKDGGNPQNRSLQVTVTDSSTMNTEMYTTSNSQTEGQIHVAAHGELA